MAKGDVEKFQKLLKIKYKEEGKAMPKKAVDPEFAPIFTASDPAKQAENEEYEEARKKAEREKKFRKMFNSMTGE